MAQRTFFIVVFFIQAGIAGLNYYIAKKHFESRMLLPSYIDILCGISWTMTALYKLWEAWMV